MPNPIRKLLEKPEVRSQIINAVSSFWKNELLELLRTSPDAFDSRQIEGMTNAFRRVTFESIESIWRERIAPQLQLPTELTVRDFCIAIETLFLSTPVDAEGTYESFVSFLASSAMVQRSCSPIRVAIVGFDRDLQMPPAHLTWESQTGFRVMFLGLIPIQCEHLDEHEVDPGFFPVRFEVRRAVYFRFEGQCSLHALRYFRRETSRVLRYAFRSYDLIKNCDHRSLGELKKWMAEKGARKCRVEPRHIHIELGSLLDAYFSNPTKKDSIDRRIRNALHLVVQSEEQRHTAIGISLSVAAIEALVCSKGGDIANMFAENTAVILEPDSTYRNAAVDFLKALYDARSRVLHGDLLEHEATMRRSARILAAAVLQAVLERRSFQRRAGVECETPDDLINELRRGKWVPGQLTGVSESPVRTLWGAEYEGPEPDIEEDQQPTSE